MLNRRGSRNDACGTPFLRHRNLLRLPLPVAKGGGVIANTSTMINRTMRLSGINRSNVQVKFASTAVTGIIRVCFVRNRLYCFLKVGIVKFLQLSFMIFAGEELTVSGFVREECEKKFENH